MSIKEKSKLNKTIFIKDLNIEKLYSKILKPNLNHHFALEEIKDKIIHGDFFKTIHLIPNNSIDLLIMDPPYNFDKKFNEVIFKAKPQGQDFYYESWFESIILKLTSKLKEHASIYVCSDWKTSISIAPILEKYFIIRNRITWGRDKGRGSKNNWKNNHEDIWYCTKSKNNFIFNLDKVKIKKEIIAGYKIYRDEETKNKEWFIDKDGKKYRFTHPSNFWNDMVIPFWSMSENTEHPTQKPEKLIERLILASSNEEDFVFDPFLGSGTTAVVAKKLNRNFSGIELDKGFCCVTQYRLDKVLKTNLDKL